MRLLLVCALATLTALGLAAFRPAVVTPLERAAAQSIRAEQLRADVRFLVSDLLDGRGPGSRGDRLAQAFIAARMEGIGLEPGAPDGSWFQPFDIVGVSSRPAGRILLARGAVKEELWPLEDVVAAAGVPSPEARIEGAEIVFGGYGIVAPEFGGDDDKGADLRGKVLLMMNREPESGPSSFAGGGRHQCGRGDEKYDLAAKMGAAGAILIHTARSAGCPWSLVESSWGGEQFSLPSEGGPQLRVKAWITEEAARRIARLSGQDLDTLRRGAERRDFRPLPLGVALTLALRSEVRRGQTANVIGRLPGSDLGLSREGVVYTAHHDHLGAKPGPDASASAACDHASGVAVLLAIAEAMKALPQTPPRTTFFAAVGGEEWGRLGSRYLAGRPPLPAGRLAADINVEGIAIGGRTRDVTQIDRGQSSLDDWVEALAAVQDRHVVSPPSPDACSLPDPFSFARIRVPVASLGSGTEAIGQPAGGGQKPDETGKAEASRRLAEDGDFAGAVEDAQLLFYLGVKVGSATPRPTWRGSDEFKATREARAEPGIR
ncbi:MAG TPA: M20/M25/M40 family metallo-hydrolase [Vicinamibacteria bacterium]|nr:M20/M25/M40 family metallo-hydrolase [Vicinamibacteria bacterium]